LEFNKTNSLNIELGTTFIQELSSIHEFSWLSCVGRGSSDLKAYHKNL